MTEYFSFKYLSRFALFIVILLLSALSELYAQSNVIYIYDDLGRLSRVVDQNDECATYEYDAVGNLLRITRSTNCLQPPIISSLSQDTANAGETICITIAGTNFLGATVTTDNPDVQISRVRVTEASIEVCLVISPFAAVGTTRIIVTTPAGVVERTITINARTLLITQSTSIGRFDRSFDGTTLTIQGPATVTIDGPHRFRSLTLRNNAIVTHPATTSFSTSKLDLTVDTTLTIDAASKINVTGRGFLGGGRPGNPFGIRGMTVGFQAGSSSVSGGSYGGLGGGPSPNPVYGDFRDPNEVGSGGATSGDPAGNGGGLIRIVAQTVVLDGLIVADGSGGTPNRASAGGSGGGVRIDVGVLSGTGSVTANGGAPGGGGGRLAIYYQNVAGFDLNRVTAFGVSGGGAGTVYLQGPARENGELIADNNNSVPTTQSTPLLPTPSGVLNLTHLRVKRSAKLRVDDQVNLTGALEVTTGGEMIPVKRIIAATASISSNGVIIHLPTTASAFFKVDLNVGSLTIDSTSKIDVTGRGFLGGGRSGNPFGIRGMTVGFQAGSASVSGGSYGGLGGGPSPNPVYGDFRDPNEVGSGGATSGDPAGNGGGLIRIVAQTVVLDGLIVADGSGGTPNRASAGGSGGGVRVDVEVLSGTGSVTANGGAPGGGGGRLAIYYQNVAGFDLNRVTAFGVSGGGAGTVYLQGPGRESGEIVVDNNNLVAPPTPIAAPPSNLVAAPSLRVRRTSVVVDESNAFTNLILESGALMTHSPTTATRVGRLDIKITGTLAVDSTSRIDVTGRGFLGGGRPGNPFGIRGMTVGFQAGSSSVSGGSYGGLGGGPSPNPVYGDFRDPNEVGSGGATSGDPAGNGGGLIRIVAQTVVLDGLIVADGSGGTPNRASAGGSGGGVRVDVEVLSGTGSVTANGGAPGGGGGRVAIYYQNAAEFDLTKVTALGAAGGGHDGTVFP